LPPSWSTLYELTKRDDDSFAERAAAGDINPHLTKYAGAPAYRRLRAREAGMLRIGPLTVLLLLAAMATARAGEIEALAREAEAKAAVGQHIEAANALRQAFAVLAANAPLSLRHAQFVAGEPKGFGVYQPRSGSSFRRGEPLIVYAEPFGMAWRAEGERFTALLTVDFEIRTPAGDILTGKKEFGRFAFESRERNLEVMTHLTLNLSGAPAGNYVFGATYHDKVSGKSASLDLPFQIQ
jgi:hypothetical protein